jgi:hypothetical protein
VHLNSTKKKKLFEVIIMIAVNKSNFLLSTKFGKRLKSPIAIHQPQCCDATVLNSIAKAGIIKNISYDN